RLSSISRSMRPIAASWSSSVVRSCISLLARWGSFQSLGSSERWFSSARRARALSKSKMPPQQSQGLLDFVDEGRNFGAHGFYRFTNDSNGDGARLRGLRKRGRRGWQRRPRRCNRDPPLTRRAHHSADGRLGGSNSSIKSDASAAFARPASELQYNP